MFKLLHYLSHWMGWNKGYVTSWHQGPRTFVAFKCRDCGRTEGTTETTSLLEREIAQAQRWDELRAASGRKF